MICILGLFMAVVIIATIAWVFDEDPETLGATDQGAAEDLQTTIQCMQTTVQSTITNCGAGGGM